MYKSIIPRILSVPYDGGTYWRKGAKEGPEAILKEFRKLRTFSLYSGRKLPFTKNSLEYCVVPINAYSKSTSLINIEQSVRQLINDGYAPYTLGGDHSITLPILRAITKQYGKQSFKIIHFDAHSDTFDSIDGYDFHHGSVFRNIVEEKLVKPADIYQFGLRGFVRDNGLTYADGVGIKSKLLDGSRKENINLLNYCINDGTPIYVSIDIDVVDPAYAPGTGTPVPGGFTSGEILDLIRQLRSYPIIGMDLVEVAPVFDVGNVTSLLAAHILMENLINNNFVKLKKVK